MNRGQWLVGALTLASLAAFVAPAMAERTPSVRTGGQKSTGARIDITVPYLTSGTNAFMGYSVAPRIYSSPEVDDPKDGKIKPVFNLIFYGSKQSFGDKSNGAVERPPNSLRPEKAR
jgi:hypothetical protein